MQLTVNGSPVDTREKPEPRMLLADFLRKVLGLRGVHLSCEMGVCGACTVLVDGQPVKSCLMLAVQAEGAEVLTVEGLATAGKLSRLQERFSECHGLQCGYCTPGMLMMAHSLVKEGQELDEAEIRKAMSGNLCRCTGYQGIVEAVGKALADAAAESAADKR
jgi:aerobic-type carbon monoxide dehydrogenase small subunit (CoxS/CutS family)